jgi:iron complex outermembrane receptor protein
MPSRSLKFIFLLFIIFIQVLNAQELDYNFYNLKLTTSNDKNAEVKVQKKRDFFEYSLKYKLSQDGYEYIQTPYYDFSNVENENFSNLVFDNHFYFDDNIWLDINMNYENSKGKTISGFGNLLYRKNSISQNSKVEFFFKPNSIVTTNIKFENTDLGTSSYDHFKNNENKKLTLSLKGEFDLFTIKSSVYQLSSDSNYFYKRLDSYSYYQLTNKNYKGVDLNLSKQIDDTFFVSSSFFNVDRNYNYFYEEEGEDNSSKLINEVYKGVELFFSKEFLENLKLIASGKITDVEIINSNKDYLIGKKPKYSPEKKAELRLEYALKNMEISANISHTGSRYTNSSNSNELDSYTLGGLGATFYTQLINKDIKINLNIENLFDKEYFLYSDTLGRPRTLFFNISMEL